MNGDLAVTGARQHAASEPAAVARPAEAGRVSVTYWSLNVVRVVLSLAVVLYHLGATIALDKYFGYDAFEKIFGFGGARIPFFFVLSGFLLTLVYAKDFGQPHKAPTFLWRRFIRVYPTYWIILLLVMSPALFMPGIVDEAIPEDAWVMFKTFLLVPQHPSVAGPTGAPVIVAAWTLHYEIVVYLLLAVWIWNRTLGALLIAAMVVNAVVCTRWECGFYSSFLAGSSFLYFAYGAAAAWLVRQLPSLPNARALVWVGALAYLLVAIMTFGQPITDTLSDPSVYYGMLASIILVCLTKAESAKPPTPGPRWIKLLSDSSYAMYLLHFPLISLCCKLLKHLGLNGSVGGVVALVLTLACCVVTAVAFQWLVERRLLALRA